MAYTHLGGGERAAKCLVDGRVVVWVGRSRNGHFLKRLFSSEADAIAAGDALDEALLATDDEDVAQAPPDLQVEELELVVLTSPDDEKFVLLWDQDNEAFWDELFPYEAIDEDSIHELQAVLDRISSQERNVSGRPGSR